MKFRMVPDYNDPMKEKDLSVNMVRVYFSDDKMDYIDIVKSECPNRDGRYERALHIRAGWKRLKVIPDSGDAVFICLDTEGSLV